MVQLVSAQIATEVIHSIDSGIATSDGTRLLFTQLAVEIAYQPLLKGCAAQLAVEVVRTHDTGIAYPPDSMHASQLALEVLSYPMAPVSSAQLAVEVIHSLDSGIRASINRLCFTQLAVEIQYRLHPMGIASQIALEIISSPDLCDCEIIPETAPDTYLMRRPYFYRLLRRLPLH